MRRYLKLVSKHLDVHSRRLPAACRVAPQPVLALVALIMCCTVSLQAATIASLKGTVEVGRSGSMGSRKAAVGMTVQRSDRIQCAAGSTTEIVTSGGHRIKLWPKSEIVLENVDAEETVFRLVAGRLRSWVKKLNGREKYQVRTPVAVCSVRGTDFSVEAGDDRKVRVEVYEGAVAAKEEVTGSEVQVRAGEFTRIETNRPPAEPRSLSEEKSAQQGERQVLNETREEARREIFQELSRESVLARSAEEIKLAEYQNGKAMVDVAGHRVRLEEYIVRTTPNEFKYVVLNTREDRFDFGKMIFTFNDTLPEDLTLATKTMFYSAGSVKPLWWLTDVLTVMSNTQDHVNEEASGGRMFPDNPANPRSWKLGFQDYTFSVNDTPWWSYADANSNGAIDAGELRLYDLNGGDVSSVASAFSQPSGDTAFHFYEKNTYASDQWIVADDYLINDDGTLLTSSNLQNLTSAQREEKAYNANFERIYSASVFNGRKIDLVFSAKLLMDAGILNLPAPAQRAQ